MNNTEQDSNLPLGLDVGTCRPDLAPILAREIVEAIRRSLIRAAMVVTAIAGLAGVAVLIWRAF
jgi:hypothetical protein